MWIWIRDVFCTQNLKVLGAKYISNQDLWAPFEKGGRWYWHDRLRKGGDGMID